MKRKTNTGDEVDVVNHRHRLRWKRGEVRAVKRRMRRRERREGRRQVEWS